MTEQMNVPKLRFGEFDGIWLSDRVGNIFDIKAGGDIDKENVSDVRNEKFPYPVFANAEKKKGLYGYSDLYKVDPPCLTVAGRGVNIGIAHARFERFYPIVRLLTLKPKKEQDVKFHEYVFNRLNIFVESTGVPQLTGPQISSYRVALPAYPEQQKIASFLSKVDEKIGLLTEKKDKLTEYKKGVMQQLFNGKWENQNGQLAFIPPTLRFKADDGSEFPDWEEKKLGDSLLKHTEVTTENNQYPVLTSSRKGIFLQTDYFNGNQIASKDNTGYNVVPRNYFTYRHMSDDLLFKFNINNIVDKGIVSTLYPVFTTKENINDYFLQSILNEGTTFSRYAVLQKQGGSRTYMYFNKLQNMRIALPCFDEQTKIANFLSAIDQKIDLANSELEKAKEWKKGLLQQMFV